ncbi:MAG TPA: aminotransferase class I/II-fold pyridoxal phosphate-dependent enzyme [Terriglobales bacterium]|nr:aminotransferase class I/II-fold pyridoxal phosphate-dependent enzyme [Terriglobales bacterium]
MSSDHAGSPGRSPSPHRSVLETPETTASASAPAPYPGPEYLADFRHAAHEAVNWIADYLQDVRRYPVLPDMKPGELVDALPASAPDHGEALDAILRDFDRQILPAVTHWNHPRFMAYFGCTGSTPAIIGEMLSAALNTNGIHWKTSPAVSELEQVTLAWLRQWLELPDDYFGVIYDTASVSSMHGLICARQMADPGARENGSRPDHVVYTSEQSHSSIEKGAIAIGVGQKNVRKIPVDDGFRMRPEALSAAIEKDLGEGKRPMCVVATIGTTSTTSVDPLPAIVDLAEKHNLWVHVDAAYAGAAAILPEHRHILNGIERAHSLVVNAHKWLLTPIDLSVFYTRRPDILKRAFSLVPEYLEEKVEPRTVSFMDYGVPLGRRFRSLKLWFVMRYFGREGIARMLRNHIHWAQEFAAWVDSDSRFQRVAPSPFSVVCFRLRGTDAQNHALLDKVNHTGKLYLSHTALHGQYVLRLAIGNLGTTREDVVSAWEMIRECAREV